MDIINQLEKEIKELFHKENSGHDLHHLKRVLNLALTLQEKEGGDKIVIGVAAFLHDLHRVIGNGKYCSPKESLPKVKEILDKVELSEVQKERILHCIEFHEEYNFTEEGKFQDSHKKSKSVKFLINSVPISGTSENDGNRLLCPVEFILLEP